MSKLTHREERLKREKAEDDAEKERKAREEEEQLAIREQKKREDDEKQAEIDRLLRIEEEKKFEAEMIRRQEEEALRDHERRLFGACNAAAKTVFFTANVLPSDAERDQLGRERGGRSIVVWSCVVLYYIIPHNVALGCIVSCRIMLHCTTLYCVV